MPAGYMDGQAGPNRARDGFRDTIGDLPQLERGLQNRPTLDLRGPKGHGDADAWFEQCTLPGWPG